MSVGACMLRDPMRVRTPCLQRPRRLRHAFRISFIAYATIMGIRHQFPSCHAYMTMWNGDYGFLLSNLIQKDFKIRYRNMSLGLFRSLLNPLVMMGVLTFVFTVIFPNRSTPHFALSILCGIVPYNFFTMAWVTGTTSLVDNTGLIKRVPVPRELVPLSAVLSNCLHLVLQIGLLLGLVFVSGLSPNVYWLWLPVVWALEVVFVCGISLITASFNVYIRDTRYVVESVNTVLFWMVPIFYSFSDVPARYSELYALNPVAALVLILRTILIQASPPLPATLYKLAGSAFLMRFVGMLVIGRLKQRFYDYV